MEMTGVREVYGSAPNFGDLGSGYCVHAHQQS